MPSISSEARFLGLDLQALWQEVRRPWLGASQWPLLRWLTPAAPVRLLLADGGEATWRGTEQAQMPGRAERARFVAVQLPADLVLQRHLSLPVVSAADVAQAAALEARANSPFAAHDLVWGSRALATPSGLRVDVAMSSRKQVDAYLAAQASRLGAGEQPEVWVQSGSQPPIVFQGFGEGRRMTHAQRARHVGYALLAAIALLGVAIAVTPTAQLRMRALQAVGAYEAARQRAAPAVRDRESLMQAVDKSTTLSELLGQRFDPLRVLERLTQVLPDDTSLQSFKMQGATVTIAGLTTNASTLMQLLGTQPGLREVNAPSAATRMAGSAKESFVIVFTLDPQVFGVPMAKVPVGEAAIAPAVSGAVPALAAASAPATPASAPAAVTAPVTAPVAAAAPPTARPAAAGGAVFGGGATFGGTAARPAAPASSSGAPTPPAKP